MGHPWDRASTGEEVAPSGSPQPPPQAGIWGQTLRSGGHDRQRKPGGWGSGQWSECTGRPGGAPGRANGEWPGEGGGQGLPHRIQQDRGGVGGCREPALGKD